jgi:hypothetical protein
VDRNGTILNTTLSQVETLTGEDIRGHTIREWLSAFDSARYLYSVELAIIKGRPLPINYTIQDVRFLALLEPLDDTVIRAPEVMIVKNMWEAMRLVSRIEPVFGFL